MKIRKIDEELADALRVAEGERAPSARAGSAAATDGLVTERVEPAPPRARSLGLLLTLLVMVGALVALFLVGFKGAAVYATPVDALASDKGALVGRKVRVEGELVPGTLVKRDLPCEYRFTVHGEHAELPVRYGQCVIPDTFRDVPGGGVQVTVEGALTAQGEFEASLVMAKCASKYDPKTHTMQGGSQAALPVN